MDQITEHLQDTILRLKQYNTKKTFKCDKCKDSGWIKDKDNQLISECVCEKRKRAEQRMKNNGLEAGKMTFSNFDEKTSVAKEMKSVAERFVNGYKNRNTEKYYSMAILGQVGSGKTHIMVAAAQELINQGIDVQYRSYTDMMATLRQNTFDQEGYETIMKTLKGCGLLVIDDLFKAIKPNSNDLGVVFEIINNRYLNKRPTMISSEWTIERMTDLDEAIGTRIMQMCSEFTLQISKDPKKNRRIYGNK